MSVLDLDGTLIDITPRWYQLHTDMAARHGLTPVPREQYVAAKQDAAKEQAVLAMTNPDLDPAVFAAYEAERVAHIEDEEYLNHDVLFPGTFEILETLKAKGPRVLLTKRKSEANTLAELERLGLTAHLEHTLITGHVPKGEALVKEFGIDPLKGVPFVSDALEDYETALALEMIPIVVTYGCRSERYFREHLGPEVRMFASIAQLNSEFKIAPTPRFI